MNIPFIKMHGCGNDYIFIDLLTRRDEGLDDFKEIEELGIAELARRLSRRHFSIGSDGIVMILPSDKAHARMRIFNADGSEGAMCGNALRCVGKHLYESGTVKKSHLRIETESGIRSLFLSVKDGSVGLITADMGRVTLRDGTERHEGLDFYAVNVGNEHRVCFVEELDGIDIPMLGTTLCGAEHFGGSVNLEFCSVTDKNRLRVRVFERGSGLTLACGTGACAAASAAIHAGLASADGSIKVEMDGGTLTVLCTPEGQVFLTGRAERSFEGTVTTI